MSRLPRWPACASLFTLQPLAAGVLLAVAGTSLPSLAEETVVATPVPEQQATLGTVTVNARRREESAQSVPTPISVLDSETLETQRIYRVQDLQQLVPSTNVAYVHARQSSISIRGLGNNPASDGPKAAWVSTDNVYLGRPGMAVFDLLDVEQLEVLRGPQGTLFGKNTTAGVLNITTRKPTFHREGSVQSSLGEDGYWQTQGSFSGPISETLAGRISAYHTEDDGYVKNVYNGHDLNGGKRQGFRTQLLFEPSETFNLRWIGEYNEEDSDNGVLALYSTGPTINGVNRYESLAARRRYPGVGQGSQGQLRRRPAGDGVPWRHFGGGQLDLAQRLHPDLHHRLPLVGLHPAQRRRPERAGLPQRRGVGARQAVFPGDPPGIAHRRLLRLCARRLLLQTGPDNQSFFYYGPQADIWSGTPQARWPTSPAWVTGTSTLTAMRCSLRVPGT